MSRTLNASIISELDQPFLRPVRFVELQLDSGTVYLHDDLGTITWGGNDFLGAGDMGGIGEIEENDSLTPNGITLSLSGIDATLLDEVRNQDYHDRTYIIYIGMRHTVTGAMVSDPVQLSKGILDDAKITTGGGVGAISIDCESLEIYWQQAPLEYYDNATLQAEYSGDLFFEFLAQMEDIAIGWGQKKQVDLGVPNTRPPPVIGGGGGSNRFNWR